MDFISILVFRLVNSRREFVVYETIDAFEDNLYSILVSETVCIIINERMSE